MSAPAVVGRLVQLSDAGNACRAFDVADKEIVIGRYGDDRSPPRMPLADAPRAAFPEQSVQLPGLRFGGDHDAEDLQRNAHRPGSSVPLLLCTVVPWCEDADCC